MHRNVVKKNKLTRKTQRLIIVIFFFSTLFVNASFLLVNYLQISDYNEVQVNSWVTSFSKSIVTNLFESNYQPISNKLEYIKNTNLFSAFFVLNKRNKIISRFGDVENDIKEKYKLISIKDSFGNTLGFFGYKKNSEFINSLVLDLIRNNLLIVFVSLVFINISFSKLIKLELSKFDTFHELINMYIGKIKDKSTKNLRDLKISMPKEIINEGELEASILNLVEVIQNFKKKDYESQVAIEKLCAKEEISLQVAHDIRSPLAALDMIIKDINEFPEQKRLIIKSSVERIHDIANDLLARNRKKELDVKSSEKLSLFLVTDELNSLISEKRIQFRDASKVSFDFDIEESLYGLFSLGDVGHFNRIISNLINNAVESFRSGDGKILLSLRDYGKKMFMVKIKDNGCGMSEDVLTKIGRFGQTFNKENGNGLGLAHAFRMIKKWSGELKISSKKGEGTEVTIFLPKAAPPRPFVTNIDLNSDKTIVILDDDKSIHQIWDGRIASEFHEHLPTLIHFSNPVEFASWMRENNNGSEVSLFLIDYEYVGHKITGIQVIKNQKIADRSVLVTSRYKEDQIQSECKLMGAQILPKFLVGFAPFHSSND